MNNITIFNNDLFGQVRGLVIDEKPYFVASDVAKVLGYKKPNNAINMHCKHALKQGIVDITGFEQSMNIIPMGDVVRLAVKSNLPGADEIEEWIMDEVIPQLLTTGVYITESATPEAITYESKFGVRRIRQTFRETTDLEATWKEFKELSQIERTAKRLTGKECVNRCNQIIDELSKFKINNLDMPYYKHALYDAMIIEALNEKQRLSNKSNGGIKSNKTKQINSLEHQYQELEEELNQWKTYAEELEEYYNPTRVWTTVDYHPFTLNKMFDNGHKTHAYNWWIRKFPVNQIPTKLEYEIYQGIDFNKPIGIDLHFVNMEKYDTDNLIKSALDMIFNRVLGVDDNIVKKIVPQTVGYCDSTDEGKIIFAIYNIDDDEEKYGA